MVTSNASDSEQLYWRRTRWVDSLDRNCVHGRRLNKVDRVTNSRNDRYSRPS